MNLDEERKLIVGLLSGRDPGLIREESLARALDAMRHKARRQRMVRSLALVCAPLVLGLVFVLISSRGPGRIIPMAQAPGPTVPAIPIARPGIEPIDDQGLLALLSGKTVALIGPPGREQLLVFDLPGQPR